MKPAEIVLIEDSSADVFLVKKALEQHGIRYAMTLFRSGLDAVDNLCTAEAPQDHAVPDLILMDLNTPRSDGFEVLKALRNTPRLAQVPIAVLTSSRARTDRCRASTLGARYIVKPSQLDHFLASVGQAVNDMLGGQPSAGD